MLSRLTLIALLSAATLCAQTRQPAPSNKPIASQPVEDLVDQLVANASVYRNNLPSLIADEDIVSDLTIYGIYHKHAEAHATFRAIRKSDDSSLDESREITILNGKPVRPYDNPTLPVVLFGGFGRFQDMFFSPQHRPCFNFVLRPRHLAAPPSRSTSPSSPPPPPSPAASPASPGSPASPASIPPPATSSTSSAPSPRHRRQIQSRHLRLRRLRPHPARRPCLLAPHRHHRRRHRKQGKAKGPLHRLLLQLPPLHRHLHHPPRNPPQPNRIHRICSGVRRFPFAPNRSCVYSLFLCDLIQKRPARQHE